MATTIGPLHVRRSIFIEALPERVWREFESADHLRAWLNLGHTVHQLESKVGSQVSLSVQIDGDRRYFGGEVLAVLPQQELTFESNWQPPYDWPVPTFWTIRLTPLYGGTMVEILHHGFERLGPEAAGALQGYEEGWGMQHLTTLRSLIAV